MKSVPEDIVRDILLKLPVKPLLRFKCLSKSWYSLISSPDFTKLRSHLSLQYNHHEKFVVDGIVQNEYVMFDAPFNFNDIISVESILISPKPIKHQNLSFLSKSFILCSCDGWLLARDWSTSRNVITLWNPSTRESRELATSGCHLANYYALGYDSYTDDYKLIEQGYTDHGFSYQVLSLRSSSWRKVKDFNSDMNLWNCFYINLNGALHWLLPNWMRNNIVCFTLAEETFIEMEMELPDDFHTYSDVNFFVLQGCLCLLETPTRQFHYHSPTREEYQAPYYLNVWLMKEYGVKASWTKFITIPHLPINDPSSIYPLPTPFCFMNKAVFIIHRGYRESALVVYDLEKNDFEVVKMEFFMKTALTFVESLVSPNF